MTDTEQELQRAIRAITVDLPNDEPNGPAETILGSHTRACEAAGNALLQLSKQIRSIIDRLPGEGGDKLLVNLSACHAAMATLGATGIRMCEALSGEAQQLRRAAEAHFGGDFGLPGDAQPSAEGAFLLGPLVEETKP